MHLIVLYDIRNTGTRSCTDTAPRAGHHLAAQPIQVINEHGQKCVELGVVPGLRQEYAVSDGQQLLERRLRLVIVEARYRMKHQCQCVVIIRLRGLRERAASVRPVGVGVFENDGEIGGPDEVWVVKVLCFRQSTRVVDCNASSARTLTTADNRRPNCWNSSRSENTVLSKGGRRYDGGAHISGPTDFGLCQQPHNTPNAEMKDLLLPM
jgi:hypothetical protein